MIAIAPSVRNFLKPALELEGPSTHEAEPVILRRGTATGLRSNSVSSRCRENLGFICGPAPKVGYGGDRRSPATLRRDRLPHGLLNRE
jgi:hypothetical protein